MDAPVDKHGRECCGMLGQANLKLLIDLLEQIRGGTTTG